MSLRVSFIDIGLRLGTSFLALLNVYVGMHEPHNTRQLVTFFT